MKWPKVRLSTFLLLVVVAGQAIAIGFMHIRMRAMAEVMDDIVSTQVRIQKLEVGSIPRTQYPLTPPPP